MWDKCGICLCPIDHVKRCEIFTRLHHFDIFFRFLLLWEWWEVVVDVRLAIDMDSTRDKPYISDFNAKIRLLDFVPSTRMKSPSSQRRLHQCGWNKWAHSRGWSLRPTLLKIKTWPRVRQPKIFVTIRKWN